MKWITRERVRTDRMACAWLIERFVDPEAVFVFAPGDQVLEGAREENAIPFHVPGAELGQLDDRTGFDAILGKYQLDDPALRLMAEIVRAADKKGAAPEAAGVNAIVHGLFLMKRPDAETLTLASPLYEALYLYCRGRVEKQA